METHKHAGLLLMQLSRQDRQATYAYPTYRTSKDTPYKTDSVFIDVITPLKVNDRI